MARDKAEGTLEDVLADDGTETVEFEYNGKEFWFEVEQELTWDKKNEITLEHTEIVTNDDGEVVEENPDYRDIQRALLEEKIVDSNIERISVMLDGMSEEFGDKLVEHVLDEDPAEGGN